MTTAELTAPPSGRIAADAPRRQAPLLCSLFLHVMILGALVLLYRGHTPVQAQMLPISVQLLTMSAAPAAAPTPVTPVEKTTPVEKKPALQKVANLAPPVVAQKPTADKPVISEKPVVSENTSASEGTGKDAANVLTVVQNPVVRSQVSPVYPPRAKELGMQGTTLLHALVEPTGQPSDLKVVSSSGHRLLDDAALAAVRQWEFEPLENRGRIQKAWVAVPVEFVLRHN